MTARTTHTEQHAGFERTVEVDGIYSGDNRLVRRVVRVVDIGARGGRYPIFGGTPDEARAFANLLVLGAADAHALVPERITTARDGDNETITITETA